MSVRLPSISLVTPSLNQGKFIRATIESVLNQGYPDLDYRVQDGGSTDGTLTVLRSYEERVPFVSEKDAGQADAINKGLAHATGEVLGYLNSDDVLRPGALAAVGEAFDRVGADEIRGDRRSDLVQVGRAPPDEQQVGVGREGLADGGERARHQHVVAVEIRKHLTGCS